MKRVKEVLSSLSFLCWKEREYGGFINLRTGKVEGAVGGDGGANLHPSRKPGRNPGQDATGVGMVAHPSRGRRRYGFGSLSGGPNRCPRRWGPTYIVTEWGVWEVLPLRTFSLERLQNRLYLARKEAREEAARLGYKEGDIDVPCPCCGGSLFFKCLKRCLPVRISLL
jgi:hypothetical protein